MQSVSPCDRGSSYALLKKDLYFVLQLINCKVLVRRGTIFSCVRHSCQKDQAEVIGEQEHKLLRSIEWSLGQAQEEVG